MKEAIDLNDERRIREIANADPNQLNQIIDYKEETLGHGQITPLGYAAAKGNLIAYQTLLNLNAPYDTTLQFYGILANPLLHWAAQGSNTAILEDLIHKGLNVNLEIHKKNSLCQLTPFLVAVQVFNFQGAQLLLDAGTDITNTPTNLKDVFKEYILLAYDQKQTKLLATIFKQGQIAALEKAYGELLKKAISSLDTKIVCDLFETLKSPNYYNPFLLNTFVTTLIEFKGSSDDLKSFCMGVVPTLTTFEKDGSSLISIYNNAVLVKTHPEIAILFAPKFENYAVQHDLIISTYENLLIKIATRHLINDFQGTIKYSDGEKEIEEEVVVYDKIIKLLAAILRYPECHANLFTKAVISNITALVSHIESSSTCLQKLEQYPIAKSSLSENEKIDLERLLRSLIVFTQTIEHHLRLPSASESETNQAYARISSAIFTRKNERCAEPKSNPNFNSKRSISFLNETPDIEGPTKKKAKDENDDSTSEQSQSMTLWHLKHKPT